MKVRGVSYSPVSKYMGVILHPGAPPLEVARWMEASGPPWTTSLKVDYDYWSSSHSLSDCLTFAACGRRQRSHHPHSIWPWPARVRRALQSRPFSHLGPPTFRLRSPLVVWRHFHCPRSRSLRVRPRLLKNGQPVLFSNGDIPPASGRQTVTVAVSSGCSLRAPAGLPGRVSRVAAPSLGLPTLDGCPGIGPRRRRPPPAGGPR